MDNDKDRQSQRSEWADQIVDRIDSVIGIARDKAVIPITTLARAVVFGILAGILGIVVVVLLAIMLVRVVDVYLPGEVWGAHAIVGGLFTLLGLLLWSRRHPKTA